LNYVNLALDSDALIKLAKSSAKEIVGSNYTLLLPPEVRRECVEQGKAGGFPDAVRVEENIRSGRLRVRRPKRSGRTEALVKDLRLLGGEADVLRLFRSGGVELVVSDDRRFVHLLEALGVPYATPSSLIAALVRTKKLSGRDGLGYLDRLAGSISEEEYVEARRAIEEG